MNAPELSEQTRSHIRRFTASSTACSQANVQYLQICLYGASDTTSNGQKKVLSEACPGSSRSRKAGKITAPKKSVAQNGYKILNDESVVFSDKERTLIAEEVVNGVLEALDAIIKSKFHPEADKELSVCNLPTKDPISASRNSKPIRETSSCHANRRAPQRKLKSNGKSNNDSLQEQHVDGLVALAQCAFLAFEYLQRDNLQLLKSSVGLGLHVERAMMAYLSKLISLRQDKLVTPVLKLLRRSLDARIASAADTYFGTNQSKEGTVEGKNEDPLADLLFFHEPISDDSLLPLVIHFQLLVLKTAALLPGHSSLHTLGYSCSLEPRNSTFNLINEWARKTGETDSPALQMEKLSHLIFSGCASLAQESSDHLKSTKDNSLADNYLRLQSLGFRCRLAWIALADHVGDIEKEVIKPFSRCLMMHESKSSAKSLSSYFTAKESFYVIYNGLSWLEKKSQYFGKLLHRESMKSMISSLSARSSLLELQEEEKHWNTFKASDKSVTRAPIVGKCSSICRFAYESVRNCISSNNEIQSTWIVNIVALLPDPLDGSKEEMECLVSDALRLRNLTIQWARKQISEQESCFCPDIADKLGCLYDLSIACIKLLLQLQSIKDREHMSIPMTENVNSSIECVLWFFTLFKKHNLEENGSRSQRGLESCANLHLSVGHSAQHTNETKSSDVNNNLTLSVRLSRALFELYTQSRQEDLKTPKVLLQLSCDILKDESTGTKLRGNLVTKLSKLARLYQTSSDFENAALTLRLLIHTACQMRILEDFPLAIRPLSSIFKSSVETELVSSAIGLFLEVEARRNPIPSEEPKFWDDDRLDVQIRGPVLEYQLFTITSWSVSKTLCQHARKVAPYLIDILLTVYREPKWLMQRQRVILQVLNLAMDTSGTFQSDLWRRGEELAINDFKDLREDSPPLGLHIKSSLEIILCIRGKFAVKGSVESALQRWSRLFDTLQNWEKIKDALGDTNIWFSQLTYLSDFLDAKGHIYLQMCVSKLIFKARQLEHESKGQEQVRSAVMLGLQLLRLGYSEQGGVFLAKAANRLNKQQHDLDVQIEYQNAYAEYFLELGEYSRCFDHLDQAKQLLENKSTSRMHLRSNSPTKVNDLSKIADRLHINSRYAFATGFYVEAFWLGVQEINMLQRAWKSLEMREEKSKSSDPVTNDLGNSLADEVSSLSLSGSNKNCSPFTSPSNNEGPRFWLLLSRLCRAATHLSRLSHYGGSFQDAVYFIDQAQKVVESARSNLLLATILPLKGELDCRRGELEYAHRYFERACGLLIDSQNDKSSVLIHKSIGYFHHLRRDWKSEIQEYDIAEAILRELMEVDQGFDAPDFTANNDSTNKSEQSTKSKKPSRVPNDRAKAVKAMEKDRPTEGLSSECTEQTCSKILLLCVLRENIRHLKARCMLKKGDLADSHDDTLLPIDKSVIMNSGVEFKNLESKLLLHKALGFMSTDATFSILAESAMSWPAAASSSKTNVSELINYSEHWEGDRDLEKRIPREGYSAQPTCPMGKFGNLLYQAIHLLFSNASLSEGLSTLHSLREKSSILTTASFLLSAIPNTACSSLPDLTPSLLYMDYPQCVSFLREQAITEVDWISRTFGHNFVESKETLSAKSASRRDRPHISREFINSIPPTWSIISMNLDEEKKNLHVTKYRRRKEPFALRLPLVRQNSDDLDEESFTFQEAKSELSEIVGLSDATIHAAREDADIFRKKGARHQWWSEREDLDKRMSDLLSNVQNMWLGGFRGIFSQIYEHREPLSCFQQAFDAVLDKYLPSRQKSKKKRGPLKVKLDEQVTELFLGLVHTLGEDGDLGEELTDLLYFVIDVLQFNGEANAYDEIDFDSMIVEIQDALNSYGEVYSTLEGSKSPQHTVLVLDKQLHCFPWESLPCLDGLSVSRVYSITEVQERLELMQQQHGKENAHDGIDVSRFSGSYILNPSRDLDKTQIRFETELSSVLSNRLAWRGLTNRAPTESEFAAALYNAETSPTRKSDCNEEEDGLQRIFLYFGHGSGTQYIRHRRIKQVRYDHQTSSEMVRSLSIDCGPNGDSKPAQDYARRSFDCIESLSPNPYVSVALLFGCSSAALSENLEFEPHGTPKSYMLAGAPALLGSLWDVTDGDIDKFASGVLERWGLFEPGTFKELRTSSSRACSTGKTKAAAKRSSKDSGSSKVKSMDAKLSLTNAVAKSREDCYLKYLNGAAMVVYGVPTYVR